MRSFVFFNGLFYKVLIGSLAVLVAAKSLITFVFEPVVPGTPLSALRDQFYPYPTGRFAITHYEHWHDGWPDYSDGVYGEIFSRLGGFIERFVAFDSVGIIVFFGLAIPSVGYVSISTFGKSRSGMVPTHVGLGMIWATAISNEGEIALFGHATDFLLIRPIGIANLADGMVLAGFILVLLASTYQKLVSNPKEQGVPNGEGIQPQS